MSASANPLLQQFIPEARDLLEQAGRSLLALERDPHGSEPMNELFRAVHTLKGTSGLFEIGPFTRVVHAAEDLLGAVQAGRLALAPEMTDVLLDTLDQVGLWVDALSSTDTLPDGAESLALAWVQRLRAPLGESAEAARKPVANASLAALPGWVASLPADALLACDGAVDDAGDRLVAVTYSPDESCFFRGEDPLALMRQISGLQILRVEPVTPWPTLEEMDPFHCCLRVRAIASAPVSDVEYLFRYVPEQVEIAVLPPGWPKAAEPGNDASTGQDPTFRTVFAAQRQLLSAKGDAALLPGRLGAAARALRGTISYAGQDHLAPKLEDALRRATAEVDTTPLLEFISECLAPAQTDPTVPAAAAAAAAEVKHGAPPTLRVEQAKIDTLMNLIGELVVAKNALAYLARQADAGALGVRELAREIKDRQAMVNRIAEDMQGAVMAVRMLPVDHIFQRFPRLVRDISRRLGKQVELVVEGGDTEADKNVIEALADPLIHIVRNSLDHGLEQPDERLALGKSEHGTIRLLAVQDSDHVMIRVSDDGRGIDLERVRAKAVEKGLIDAERALSMSDEEAVMLVFAPSFSTAATISDLSGRGVGMDVVRSAVEKAGGRVALNSRKGQGTTVELTLPLSMAVTRIMTIACGQRQFGVPMSAVVETVRVPRAALHRFRDREALVLRDSVVPVVRLARLLDLPEDATSEEEAVLVVRLNGERLGIVVGAFRDVMEVIVKPMEGVLADISGFSGTTLLGDGRVLLILDLRELIS